ncbi:MAG TPA: histidine--tRNA ligase [Spirochaetia bacterium]|nr:histidine--tRNA ligase [Spirochaetia bacterium]
MLNTLPLKGMNDYFPDDQRKTDYILEKISAAAHSFAYEKYDAPVLEPVELFSAKSSVELVNEQSYNFTDKGGRHLILRPEMTPSMARMMARVIKEKPKPLRWYSFPNCYRYERPQKGRLREFRQINFDLVGTNSIYADAEMISLLRSVFSNFGASENTYSIRFNDRRLINSLLGAHGFNAEQSILFFSTVDKKGKMPDADYNEYIREKHDGQAEFVLKYLQADSISAISELAGTNANAEFSQAADKCREFISAVNRLGINNLVFSPSTVRGLDYYTGIVFEIFAESAGPARALCGGGRYDNLLGLFSGENLSGTGFGMGVYILGLFLEENGLLPDFSEKTASEKSAFCFFTEPGLASLTAAAAAQMRLNGWAVEFEPEAGKIPKMLGKAQKKGYKFCLLLGPDEEKKQCIVLKNLENGENREIKVTQVH